MMRPRHTCLVLVAALALAGCGSDEEGEPIPAGVADALDSQLTAIQGRVAANHQFACADIEKTDDSGTFAEIERQIESIPANVDRDVVDALQDSVDRLKDLVRGECTDIIDQTETTPEQTETITIETVPEETTPTETVPEETTPTETVPEEEQGKGNQNGGGTEPGGGETGGGVPAPGGDE